MRTPSLHARILLLTLVPVILLSMVMGTLLLTGRFQDLEHIAAQRAEIVIEKYRLKLRTPDNDYQDLRGIAADVLDEESIRSFSLLDGKGAVMLHVGPATRPMTTTPGLHANPDIIYRHTDNTDILLTHAGLLPDEKGVLADRWMLLEISRTETLLKKYETVFLIVLVITFGLGLTTILILSQTRRLFRPLQTMLDTTTQLRGGNLELRFDTQATGELDELEKGLNRMLENLQSEVEDLKLSMTQANEDLRETLEAMEVQNIELSLARKEAVEGNRIKSEFLANISHEIRTPLNGIMGFAKLLLRTPMNSRQLEYVHTIQKSSDSLLAIINDVLDLSKIEAGKLVLDHSPVDIEDLIFDVLGMLAPLADEKNLEQVAFIYDDVPRHLLADPLRLKQVLTNLVNNAIKFTEKGEVTVRVMLEEKTERHATLHFSVSDTGVGLSESAREDLFRAFSQGDASTTRKYGGTGLGLVISKHLVEQMGGEISFDSTPGQGATFWFTIRAELDRFHSYEAPPSFSGNKRVALVAPHAPTRQTLTHGLEMLGCQVVRHDDLSGFIATPESLRCDLLLLVAGNSMPFNNTASEIARHFQGPVIVLHRSSDHFAETLDVPRHQFHFLTKPASPKRITAMLGSLLEEDKTLQLELMPEPPTRHLRILAVDDNLANLKLVCALLEDLSIAVDAASSGQEAIALTQKNDYDLIFMDVQMPGMSGVETAREIRLLHRDRHIPIVALTAHALASEKEHLLNNGMDDYVTKPLQENLLTHIIAKWTGVDKGLLVPPAPPAPTPVQSVESAPVVDEAEGLRLAAGKAQLATDMLAMLLESLDKEEQKIREAFESGHMENLLARVHYLHGATRYCGVPRLRARSADMESAIKSAMSRNDDVRTVAAPMQALMNALAELKTWSNTQPGTRD